MSRHRIENTEIRRIALLILLLAFLSLKGTACGPAPRTFLNDEINSLQGYRVALLPLDNLSGVDGAAEKIDEILLVELLRTGSFQVIEPGEVERVLLELRIRRTSELSSEDMDAVSERLNADALLVGSVLEYGKKESRSIGGDLVPSITIVLRLVDVHDGRVRWASSHSRTGDDAEKVFGIGRIRNYSKLSKEIVKEMLESLELTVSARK